METKIDQVGRIVIPKQMRDQLGLVAGSGVDVSLYGDGIHLAPACRTARLERHEGRLVAVADTVVTDDDVFGLLDQLRR